MATPTDITGIVKTDNEILEDLASLGTPTQITGFVTTVLGPKVSFANTPTDEDISKLNGYFGNGRKWI